MMRKLFSRVWAFCKRFTAALFTKVGEFFADLWHNWRAAAVLSFAVLGMASFAGTYLGWSPMLLTVLAALIVYLLVGDGHSNEPIYQYAESESPAICRA
jgi:hypothetical protein